MADLDRLFAAVKDRFGRIDVLFANAGVAKLSPFESTPESLFDEMVNTFDPDALIVGGGAIETGVEFQRWFVEEIRRGMPAQRVEQADIPIYIMPNGDTAGARGAAIQALQFARRQGL